jgi:hypothetical protein
MKRSLLLLVGSLLLASAGCRSDPAAIAVLERELRLKEDEIYRLRATVDDLQYCEQSSPQRADGGSASKSPADADDNQSHPKRGPEGPNGIAPPVIQMPSQPDTKVPDVLKGAYLLTPTADSRQVASIAIDRALTGGVSADGIPGDQGLLVVVEPRDRAGRTVDAPAEISIVLLDPALKDRDGTALRVARWDFTAAETAALFRRNGARKTIHLTTPWLGDPPAHGNLHLFVRYVTGDGRKLQADTPVVVALPSDATRRASQVAQETSSVRTRRPTWSPDRP